MVTPVVRGAGRAKLMVVAVTFALQAEHDPVGIVEESVPGVLEVTGAPDVGDAR
jgi:hypothetical protein